MHAAALTFQRNKKEEPEAHASPRLFFDCASASRQGPLFYERVDQVRPTENHGHTDQNGKKKRHGFLSIAVRAGKITSHGLDGSNKNSGSNCGTF